MATIKIPSVKSTKLIRQPINEVTYSDGVIIQIEGANNSTTRKPLYLKAKEITPPIIIIPPVGPREIGNKELSQLKDVENEKFELKPGIYTDRCDLTNVQNISIDGLGKVQFETGTRAIQFNGSNPSGVKLNGFSFKNINDYCVDFWGHGSLKTPTKGFEFTNMKADSCGTIFHIDGELTSGLIEDLIIKNLSFVNSKEPRSVIYIGNGKNYNISGCIIDNINYAKNVVDNGNLAVNGIHNGIFQLGGWGKVFNNKFTNHQGNSIRSWLFSQDETGLVEIYNNLIFNSWKYGAFELQNKLNGKPANAKIYNNTVGRMNVSKDWEGQILDLYNTGGTLEYFNNLGFELNGSKAISNMINNMSDVKIIEKNNVYKNIWQDAVDNLTNFKSKINGIGAV